LSTHKIAVIGLGYVGLPLALAFGEKYRVKGFDINAGRIEALSHGDDHTKEADRDQLVNLQKSYSNPGSSSGLFFTDDPQQLADCTIYIVTVPTPVDLFNVPDLSLLQQATEAVALTLQEGNLVIYESTVYPGCTEEIAVPILEKSSGLKFNKNFYCGYSPERINPGDKTRTIKQIKKITSGSTRESAELVDDLYSSVITAGTYPAPSIKVAEAAKVIENTQRDVNIAFVNELSKIFNLLGIDTQEVLKAAATKWNFLPFQPGLVGGHCIGIDPYYLAHKAVSVGFQPEIILAARKINDSMGEYVAGQVVQLMAKKQIALPGAEVLVMGITFKENFADMRNSKVVDIIKSLEAYHLAVTIFDPWASSQSVKQLYNLDSLPTIPTGKKFAAVIVAVNHSLFTNIDYNQLLEYPGVLYDVKGGLTSEKVDGKL
jgi:UDP-N-acetyl-D-galactosamine dehydrogenase